MTVYTSSQIKNMNLDKRPAFYDNMGGANPYVSRLARGKDTRRNFLKPIKAFDIKGRTTLVITEIFPGFYDYATSFTQTITHNLGFFPYPLAQLKLDTDYFPFPFAATPGIPITAQFTDVGKDSLTLSITSSAFIEEVDVDMRVYLLRESQA